MRRTLMLMATVTSACASSAETAAPADADPAPALDASPMDAASADAGDAGASTEVRYVDVTATHLPPGLSGFTMDARPADVDEDGDLDLVLASEFRRNILLLNDGQGRFVDARQQLPDTRRDSEDVVVHDFDGDGTLDFFFASEDDQRNELFLGGVCGYVDASDRIPITGVSNAVVLDESTRPATVLLGNAGQNTALRWSTTANGFVDVTAQVLPNRLDQTQDLELGDVDGDGDLDLAVGNEDASVIWLRDDDRFDDAIPLPGDFETREIDLFDADGDGDLDVALANIQFIRNRPRSNRILLQTAVLVFEDRTEDVGPTGAPRLPSDDDNSFDIDAIDLDGDGDLDLMTANLDALSGNPANAPFRAYLNNGQGWFVAAEGLLPPTAVGNGFDIEAADFDGDGRADLFLASRGGPDRLLLRR